ncbi:MAG: cytochrome c [Cycloclasticus sp.]|nr:cytochrome C [Cycloclasticus sp. 46_83_sub15_T18]OUR83133.1 cytochrome C [Cycloclasticus sp. 46_120_T64]
MKQFIKLVLAISVVMGSANVIAADVAKGKEKSVACAACHGVDGNSSSPMFPKIAGQHADYMIHALQGYKSAKRKNPMMQATVGALSDEDIINLAAYFSAQEGLQTLRR